MGPAVEHLGAIVGSGQSCGGDGSRGNRRWSRADLVRGTHVGAVEACLASGETPKAFFVSRIEDCLEFSKGSGGSGAGKPGFTCMGEHTSGLKEEVGKIDGDGIRDGVSTGGSDASHFAETFSQKFDWLSRGPQGADACPVLFKVGAG